jgi:hypothetical protein
MEIEVMSKECVKKCPNCGSSNMTNMNNEIKCLDCGMGKYENGKH